MGCSSPSSVSCSSEPGCSNGCRRAVPSRHGVTRVSSTPCSSVPAKESRSSRVCPGPERPPDSCCCAATRSPGRSSCRFCCRFRRRSGLGCWRTPTRVSRRLRWRQPSPWVSRRSSATRVSTPYCVWSNGWRSGRCVSGSVGWRWWVEP